MKLHANAALSLNKRRLLARRVVEEGWSLVEAAEAAEVSEPTARKWVGRYRVEGEAGLLDRSSAAHASTTAPPSDRIEAICALRRLRMTGAEIAEVLRDGGDDRLGDPHPGRPRAPRAPRPRARPPLRALPPGRAHPHRRQEARADRGRGRAPGRREAAQQPEQDRRPGVAAARSAGSSSTSASTTPPGFAYVEVLADEKATTAVGFLRRGLAFYRRHGVSVERGDDRQRLRLRSTIHAIACRALGIRHLRTRPYRPQTNGKAERFIRTMLGGWAYGAIYRNSAERTAALEGWLWRYNFRRTTAPSAEGRRQLGSPS